MLERLKLDDIVELLGGIKMREAGKGPEGEEIGEEFVIEVVHAITAICNQIGDLVGGEDRNQKPDWSLVTTE